MSKTNTDKIAINAVEIDIAGTKLKLTLEQVAELKKILDKAFPDKETIYVPGPAQIIYRDRWPIPHWERFPNWEVTCKSTGSSSAALCLAAH